MKKKKKLFHKLKEKFEKVQKKKMLNKLINELNNDFLKKRTFYEFYHYVSSLKKIRHINKLHSRNLINNSILRLKINFENSKKKKEERKKILIIHRILIQSRVLKGLKIHKLNIVKENIIRYLKKKVFKALAKNHINEIVI